MNISKLALTLAIGSLALGCVISDDDADGSGTTTDGSATGTTNTTPGMTMTQTGTNTNGQTGDTTEGPSTATDTGMTDSGTTAVDPGPFVDTDPDPALYTQVDRMGMPAVNTALISCSDPDPMADDCNKNDYNEAGRADDTSLTWATDITNSIEFVRDGLAADLSNPPDDGMDPPEVDPGLGLTLCGNNLQCFNQASPVIIPDTIRIDMNTGAGFPNGRGLADQVMDITLAVLLLDVDLGNGGTHPPDLFASVPVNPPENDVAFGKTFPFLAPAH